MAELREAIESRQTKAADIEDTIKPVTHPDQLSLIILESEELEQVDQLAQSSPKIETWTTREVRERLGVSDDRLTELKKSKKTYSPKGKSVTIQFLREELKPRKTNLWEVELTSQDS